MSETTRVMKRLINYWREKRLAEKCGLKVQDICEHDFIDYYKTKEQGNADFAYCKKCGVHDDE